ncbi:MAG: hypothetical protein K0Q77_2447, partial [Anaerosporomusa subterranea]|nr:hypothetical protein [Anaerosporomusa subterranea]
EGIKCGRGGTADAPDLGSGGATRGGSNPLARTISFIHWGVAKLAKASDSDSDIRGFKSFLPSQLLLNNVVYKS